MADRNNLALHDTMNDTQMLEQIPTPVMSVDTDLKITYLNIAGREILGKSMEEIKGLPCSGQMNSLHCNTDDCCMRKAINDGQSHSARNEININGKKIPIEYYAVPLKDENGRVVGGLEYVLDITERVRYEERLRQQARTIKEISTPAIKLWDGIVILPVVGMIDTGRAQQMMETMLNKIMETSCTVIILDIQGVVSVDTAVANHLIKITKATKLMGAQCIISGVSPAVAQSIVQLGINMGDIKTKATLKDALAYAFQVLNLEVKPASKLARQEI